MLDLSPMKETPNATPDSTLDSALDLEAIRKRLEAKQGKAYWRSLEELADTAEFQEFLHKEFPRQAAPLAGSVDRRDVLKLLGASLALAGLAGCARPVLPNEKIVPYVRAPEEVIPGKPLFFASAVTDGGYAEGLLVESHMGRPTKVEGNPDHPASLGATTATTQATVLTLYDPDRSQLITENGQPRSWTSFAGALQDAVAGLEQGRGLAVLTETVTSPSMARLLAEVQQRYPEARWHQFDPLHADNAVEGARLAFGEPVATTYDFSQADVVLSLDADFTNRGVGKLRYAKEFARRRRVRHAEDEMNRLYQVETSPSPTGSIADHRLPATPTEIAAFAAAVAHELGVDELGIELPEASVPAGARELLEAVVADLEEHGGRSIVIAGDSQPPVVHALVHAINERLGNVGSTVSYRQPVEVRPVAHGASLAELTSAMNAGEVEVLLILGGNPVYTAPADLEFANALERVPFSAHLSLYFDETSAKTTWHLSQTHYLENWSDARAFDGTASIIQPLIAPFYGGKSELELLAALLGDAEATAFELVRATWRALVEGDFDAFWRDALYRGVVPGSEAAAVSPSLQAFPAILPAAEAGLVVTFQPDPGIGDGRYANNGWLQELPKPLSKLTWDNAAFVSPATAEELGVRNGDVLSLNVGDRSVEAPVWLQPGQARGTLTVNLGYGRTQAGQVGNGVGFDAYRIRTSAFPWSAPVEVSVTQRRHQLVSTQDHHAMEGTTERRHIVRDGTLAAFREHPEHPEFVHPVEHHESDLYPDYEYNSYKWGMVIDMTVCTGCNACITACQAENNIPVVGKDQVAIGREMHWIRVDSYHRGSLDNPEFFQMPMTCHQCEKAPCEPVCPVGATVHDSEGINVMVYNRCVGTRYCSNNCPFKVRRYNWLQYAELTTNATELSLAYNPDVTVRSRGVMEKCTYCHQRIAAARIDAINADRPIADGEVVTACQAACPTEAIVFGDINNADSQVAKTKASPLNYTLLDELNLFPRTSYLARISNPSPALAGEETGA